MTKTKWLELKNLYHIPNGGSRHPLEAINLKRQGVKSGVPDICLPVARGGYHGLYIELKAGRKSKPSENQMIWIVNLKNQGYKAEIAYGYDEAIGIIIDYLTLK